MKRVIIMRGLPGSGKTHRAKNIAAKLVNEQGQRVKIVSADDFFVVNGKYTFDVKRIAEAHNACFEAFLEALAGGVDVVIVDNTNCQKWEFKKYVLAAKLAGYDVAVETTMTAANTTIEELRAFAARNIHGVPAATIGAMAIGWED